MVERPSAVGFRLRGFEWDAPTPAPGNLARRRLPAVPWTLQRYLSREVLHVALLALVAISFLSCAITAYQVVRSGLHLSFVWPFLLKSLAFPLYFSVPMALLFGVTLTVGRMVADLELAAMRTHGVSHLEIYAPVMGLALLFAVFGYVVNGWVVPGLSYQRRNLQRYVLDQLENLGSGVNRTILLPDDGGSLLVGEYHGTHLRRVHIDLRRSLQSRFVPEIRDQLPRRLPEKITVLAQEGRLEITEDRRGLLLHLRGIEFLVPETISGTPRGYDRFHQKIAITETLTIPLSFEPKAPRLNDLADPALRERIAELRAELRREPPGPEADSVRRELHRARSHWHRRLAFSLSSLTFSLAGLSLCFLLDGRSRLVPFFAGLLLSVSVYYPLLMVGSYLGEKGVVPPLSLALPNVALLVPGALMTRKVLRQ